MNCQELDSVAKSLIISFELEEGRYSLKFEDNSIGNTKSEEKYLGSGDATSVWKQTRVSKREYKLCSSPESLRESSPSGIHWV